MENSITYRKVISIDLEQLEKFYYKSFFRDEPLTVMLDIQLPDEMKAYVDIVMKNVVDHDLSFVALDGAEIVGCRVTLKTSRDKPMLFDIPDVAVNHKLLVFVKAVEQLYTNIDLFEYLNCDKYVMFKGLAVKDSYRNKGIATELVSLSLKECNKQGYNVVTVETTNNYSRAIYDRLGFVRMCEKVMNDMIIDEKKLVRKEDRINKYLVLHVKQESND